MNTLKNINLGLRFILELVVLISFGYWGFKISTNNILKICIGIGLPLITAILWGAFVSPKAPWQVSKSLQWIILFTLYLLSASVLFSSEKNLLGIIFLITITVNSFIMYIWKQ